MLKKKLEPLKKPANYNEGQSNEQTIIECLTQLVKEQRKMNAILQSSQLNTTGISHYLPGGLSNSNSHGKFIIKMNDDINQVRKEKYTNPLEGLLKQDQEVEFPKLFQQGEKLMTTALSQKIPASEKKNYNVLNEFIPYTDRREYKIIVDFETVAKEFPIITTYQVLQQLTIQWIGDVFRMVASMCWNMVFNGFLTFDETKILFTENIIYNYIEFMKELELRGFSQFKHKLTSTINKKSVEILDFLGKQFPQTKVDAPNIHLKEILPKMNNTGRIKFDVITLACSKGFVLRYKESGNYAAEIMTLINFIIDEVNEKYPEYQKECLFIFEQIFKRPQKRAKPDDKENGMMGRQQSLDSLHVDTTDDIDYRQKVKKYTKFLIGRKINKNVPKFTRQEINNGVFFPKSPSILRILTKWVEQLTDIIKNPDQILLGSDKQLKGHNGNFVVLFTKVKQGVCDKIKQNRSKLFQKLDAIKQECYYIQSLLSAPRYTQDSTQAHLSVDQICVGKFSVYLQKAISSYLFQQLNEILHFLLKIPIEVDETQIGIKKDQLQSQARKELDQLNLVTMKVFDFLRCKCTSNEEEIIWIMNYLIDKNLVRQFKLVRVKDRLSEGTRDILCNVRFKKGVFLSQMQLSVVSNIESKQQKLDYYNHFLYEQKRSKLGPLSENVSIWTVLEQRSLYFQKISRNPIPQQLNMHKCDNENLQKFPLPICCDSCYNFYPYPETIYSNVKCKKCKKTYCGECYCIVLSNSNRKSMIFEKLFKENVLEHINIHKDPTKPFPLEGIYFKRYHERREINFFTVLIKNSQTQQPISFESIKQIGKEKNEIQCEIIFIHNSIRNMKAIEKQKKTKDIVRATIRNGTQLYINKDDYKFFDQYLVFYFDQKFKQTLMTLDQIENYLKFQKNFSLKVLNIMEDPVYADEIRYLRKKSEKVRELNKLRGYFESNPDLKFLTLQYGKTFIVAKVYKDSIELGHSIRYANNIAELKESANAQRSIMSMEKHNLKEEFNNLSTDIGPRLTQYLYKNLRKLYLNYNALQTLEGLRPFIYLQVLYTRYNNLVSVKGVQGMKDLIVLRIDYNKITDIEPLRELTGLRRLMGVDNKVKSLEPLRNLTQLKTIQFEQNLIESLDAIKDLPNIEDVNFRKNPTLKEFPQFTEKKLKYVALSNTGVRNLQNIKKHTRVSRLMLEGLQLTEIPEAIQNMKLNELWLGQNEITQITNLEGQSQLQILSLKNNHITNLKSLPDLDKIKILYLQGNEITSLQGIKSCLETLTHINLKQNPLDYIKPILYAEETLKFEYTPEILTQKAKAVIDELYAARVNSSGSED